MRGVRFAGLAAAMLLTSLAGAGGSVAAASAVHPRPLTVPAIEQWYHGSGKWQLGPNARILVWPKRAGTLMLGRQLSADLRHVIHRSLPVAARRDGYRAGDVILHRSNDLSRRLGDEGYALEVSRFVRVTAPTSAGLFYGGRSLIQLLHQAASIPRGFGLDSPRYPERGLMVDASRTTYTTKWMLREIRRLAALKLNVLHLHLTDDQRWGIESRSFPALASKGAFSRADIARILRLAHRDHVTVIPEIEMPGHLAA
ncbi:MAG TPA: family 20 glycosylhydrolase, partial [Mycobacteriales bacterium]|nr:family 20 glycosylhydrolase [Mycobacteriales bacterium]